MKKKYIKSCVAITFFAMLSILAGCDAGDGFFNGESDSGTGGSLNRFVISGDYMYVVDDRNLKVFKITEPEKPSLVHNSNVGFSIETIYAFNSTLFIGSEFGVYVYDITNPEVPEKLDESMHVVSCDPVVADNKYAYVTLSTSSFCGRGTNELQILDIADPRDIEVVKTYPMDGPKGLAVQGNKLFICDRYEVKIYDKSNVQDLELLASITLPANDIIVLNDLLLFITDRQLEQYRFEETPSGYKTTFLSKVYDFND